MDDGLERDRATSPSRGRPRDPELTDRLLSGALDLVAGQGLDRFNADALATATGAGKAAIYRRWPTAEVLLGAAVRRCRPVPAPSDTGTLRGDLVALLGPWTQGLGRDERALAAVLGHARHSPDLRAGLEAAVAQPLHAAVCVVADQHAARGHEVGSAKVTLLCRLVLALWWERYISHPAVSTEAEVEALVDRALMPVLLAA